MFTDATLIAIAEARPRTDRDLFKVQGLGTVKVGKYGEQVLAILAAERSEPRGFVNVTPARENPHINVFAPNRTPRLVWTHRAVS